MNIEPHHSITESTLAVYFTPHTCAKYGKSKHRYRQLCLLEKNTTSIKKIATYGQLYTYFQNSCGSVSHAPTTCTCSKIILRLIILQTTLSLAYEIHAYDQGSQYDAFGVFSGFQNALLRKDRTNCSSACSYVHHIVNTTLVVSFYYRECAKLLNCAILRSMFP